MVVACPPRAHRAGGAHGAAGRGGDRRASRRPLGAWCGGHEGVPGPLGRSAEAMLSGVDLPLHCDRTVGPLALGRRARSRAALPIPRRACASASGRPAGEMLAVAPHDQSDPGHEVVELGTSTVRLRTLLSCGGDMLREPLPLVDAWGGTSGELTVSVLASEATTRLFGVRSWEGESIRLVVHGVSLDAPGVGAHAAAARRGQGRPTEVLRRCGRGRPDGAPRGDGPEVREISRRLRGHGGGGRIGSRRRGGGRRWRAAQLFADWR